MVFPDASVVAQATGATTLRRAAIGSALDIVLRRYQLVDPK
jgi:hypothetical protein